MKIALVQPEPSEKYPDFQPGYNPLADFYQYVCVK